MSNSNSGQINISILGKGSNYFVKYGVKNSLEPES